MKIYRFLINKIDNSIVKLLNYRYKLCQKIGIYKKEHNIPVYDSNREQ